LAYDQTTVHIRERSLLDLLDLALVVVRRWPVTLGLAALAGIVPFAALNAWAGRTDGLRDVYVDAIVLPWFEAPLATAPLTVVLGGLMFGERPSPGRVARALRRAYFPLILYQVIIRGLLFFTVFVIPTRLPFLNEVILLEGGSWRKAARRSAGLCGDQGTELFFQWMVQLFFGFLFVVIFWSGTNVLVNALFGSELTWDEPGLADLRGFTFGLGLWLAIAFFGVVRFLTYIDQRTRLEGWEVTLRLKAVGHALEEAREW
jgi:hypothetical protein